MLRRFVLFLTLACVIALALPLAAHAANKVTVELPLNGTVADDVHIVYYYYNSSGNAVAMPVSSAQAKVWNGSSWVSAGTVSISGGTTVTVTSPSSWPTTGRVAIQATVTKPAWNTEVKYWYQWTYGGIATNNDYAYGESDFAASGTFMLDATVQRAIKLTVTGPDAIDFGRVRFGNTYTETSQFLVESNDHYDLFLSAEYDDPLSRGDMREFLAVSVENPESGTSAAVPSGGLAGGPPENTLYLFEGGGGAGGTELVLPPPPDPDWWVESFFDVTFELDPMPGDKPGFYRSYVDAYAVQSY